MRGTTELIERLRNRALARWSLKRATAIDRADAVLDTEAADTLATLRRELEEALAELAKRRELMIQDIGLIRSTAKQARADAIETCAKIAECCGNFGDYTRDELTPDYGQPRFDLVRKIASAIRAATQKERNGK